MTSLTENESDEEGSVARAQEVGKSLYEQRQRNISTGLRSLTVQNFATSILAFVFLGALLRLLPSVQYGVYSAVSILVGVAASVATLGLQYASARYVSFLQATSEREAYVAARRVILLSLLTTACISVAFLLMAPFLSLFFTKSPSWSDAFEIGALWLFSSSIALVLQGVIQGLRKYSLIAWMLFASRVAMVIFTIGGLLLYRSVLIAVAGWVVYSGILALWSMWIITSNFGDNAKKGAKVTRFGYSEILRYSAPLGAAGILVIITSNSDLIAVGGYLNATTLAVYNTVVSISSVLTFVFLTPLSTALLPEASSSSQNRDEVSSGIRLAVRFIMLAILPASFLVAALSHQLLELFSGGGAYLAGAHSLELIALFYGFLAIQSTIYSLLQATGRSLDVFMLSALTSVIEIGLSVLLVPEMGIVGAAISRDATAVVGALVALVFARRYSVRYDSSLAYVKMFACSGVLLALLWVLSTFVSASLFTIVPYTLVGCFAFLSCLKWLRVLRPEDKQLIGHALPAKLRKVLTYL
ncbi:MAG TPA: oligosaccharide flippase family protein [Nitrososphaerales archaeon]|nr:oligosaccharide flippase family protein [Nitrososphaerales archaeon]